MAIKTINGILKTDSTKTSEEFNSQIKTACDNAESADVENNYTGLVFNLKDKRIDFVPSSNISSEFSVNETTIIDGASGSVSTDYIRTTPMPDALGGADAGTTFDGTINDALDKILYPYVEPRFTNFSIASQETTLEVGDKVTGGTRTFNWSTDTDSNIENSSIKLVSGTTTLADNLENTGSYSVDIGSDIVQNTATNHYFRIYGTNTQGNDFNRLTTVYWKWRAYFGSSSKETFTESDVKTLQNSFLNSTRSYTYNTNETNYKWICYPVNWGQASSFTDVDTGFAVAMETPQTINVTNSFGVSADYYCYRSTNSMASSVKIKVS